MPAAPSHLPALAASALALAVLGCGVDTSATATGTEQVTQVPADRRTRTTARVVPVPGVAASTPVGPAAVRVAPAPAQASAPVPNPAPAPAGAPARPAAVPPVALARPADLGPISVSARSTSPPRYDHVPSVYGMRMRDARVRIAAHGFGLEAGRRFGLVSRTARVARFAPDEADDRVVVAQTPQRPQPARRGDVVVLGTERAAIPRRKRPTLVEIGWRSVRYAGGELRLGGLRWTGDCVKLDHVQLGPAGEVRTARVWAQWQGWPRGAGCERRAPATVRVRPGAGWTRETIVWNGTFERPRDDLGAPRRERVTSLTVQPDRRTVMVGFGYGGCDRLAGATAEVRGRRVTIDVRLGTLPPPPGAGREERVCTADLRGGTAMIRLDRRLSSRARFFDAHGGTELRDGGRDRPGG